MKNTLEDIIGGVKKPKTKNENFDIDSESLDAQAKLKRLETERYGSDTEDRKWLAKWTAWVVSAWLLLVLVILMLNDYLFCLSGAVLISLLGTTTLNVLGLSFIVLRGHFNSSTKG